MEASQSLIRIVGLSATLPTPKDVGTFLGVNASSGLFTFDGSYRPIPLSQKFVGVTESNVQARAAQCIALPHRAAPCRLVSYTIHYHTVPYSAVLCRKTCLLAYFASRNLFLCASLRLRAVSYGVVR